MPTFSSAVAPFHATRRTTLSRMVDGSTVLLLSVIAILIVVLALLILFHHNLNATKGYKLRTLEIIRKQLMSEKEALNMEIARAQSLAMLASDPQLRSMKKPGKIVYVKDDPIAVRQRTAVAR